MNNVIPYCSGSIITCSIWLVVEILIEDGILHWQVLDLQQKQRYICLQDHLSKCLRLVDGWMLCQPRIGLQCLRMLSVTKWVWVAYQLLEVQDKCIGARVRFQPNYQRKQLFVNGQWRRFFAIHQQAKKWVSTFCPFKNWHFVSVDLTKGKKLLSFLKLLRLLFSVDIPGFVATLVPHEWWAWGGWMVLQEEREDLGKTVFWPDFPPQAVGTGAVRGTKAYLLFILTSSTDQFDLISPFSVDRPTLVFQCFWWSCAFWAAPHVSVTNWSTIWSPDSALEDRAILETSGLGHEQPLPWPQNL